MELLKQYRAAVVTAEALVWHHGYKGLDAALSTAESPIDDFRAHVRADLVARLAADRYLRFKHANVFQRAELLERWSRRRGQMIRGPKNSPHDTRFAGLSSPPGAERLDTREPAS